MPKVFGCDVARFGDDASVIIMRWGQQATAPLVMRGKDTQHVAGAIVRQADEWKPDAIFIDDGGVGGGVTDRLRALGYRVIPVQFGASPHDPRYSSKRTEMWFSMKAWFAAGGAITKDERLIRDLCSPRYEYRDGNDRIALEKKSEIKKRGLPSPDYADALALTFAEPVRSRDEAVGAASRRQELQKSDFHPFKRRP